MKLLELSAEEYRSIYTPCAVYAGIPFTRLNAPKVNRVHYLSMANDKGKHRLGIIVGESNDRYSCPFSAPFGEIARTSAVGLDDVNEFLDLLKQHLADRPLRLTLAPPIYDDFSLKVQGLAAARAVSSYYDFNYHYDLSRFPKFTAHLDRSARNHFNRSLKAGFEFEKPDDLGRAYRVIQTNRADRGFPLRMTEEQVRQTAAEAVTCDAFVVTLNGIDVASAIIYHAADGIAQVIYWGNVQGFNEHRPMNWLAFKVMEHYHREGFKIVDIGPSSEDGVPNFGLCEFKEAIGCLVTLKPTFFL
jgi:hypothetical protein